LVDIFWGLYQWLDAHTSETVIVSVKVDEGNSTQNLQQTIYDAVTGQDVSSYWVQSAAVRPLRGLTNNLSKTKNIQFPTLGEARNKAILLRRFAFDQLQNITAVGVDASSGWSDNNASFTINYSTNNDMLYIEDLYDLTGPDSASAIEQKLTAVTANLDLATGSTEPNQMFISFLSGYSGVSVTPQGLAEGNGTNTPGVNTKALAYLAGKRGSRFGAVLFDFIGSDTRLVPATLSQPVDLTASPISESTPTTTGYSSHSLNGATGGVTFPHKAVLFTLGVSLLSATGFVLF
jgi:1-phosphatidylinositol phosphodiesterase